MRSKEACIAGLEAAFELGAKNVRCDRIFKDRSFFKPMEIGKKAKSQNSREENLLLKNNRVLIHDIRGKFKPNWMGPYLIRDNLVRNNSHSHGFRWLRDHNQSM